MIEAEIWKEREHVHITFSCGITFKTACTMDANLSNFHTRTYVCCVPYVLQSNYSFLHVIIY